MPFWFFGSRAVENNLLHLLTPEALGTLLAEDPAEGIYDIALSAAIGTDDAGNPGMKIEGGLISERFEPY